MECIAGFRADVARIDFNGYSFSGEYLIINYTVNYPGVTKIKMWQGDQLLWRDQYLDDKGERKIVLKANKLISGTEYYFELEYKAKKQNFFVTAP